MAGGLAGLLTGWPAGWLAGWPTGWLAGLLASLLKGRWTMTGCYLLGWWIETTCSNTLDAQERFADYVFKKVSVVAKENCIEA